jgi:hypothetical protein
MLALQGAGLFNPNYLHLHRLNRHTNAGRMLQETQSRSDNRT